VTTALKAEPLGVEKADPARPPYLTPVLSWTQDAVLRLLALAWLLTSLLFWLWWLAPARGDWTPARAIATAGLGWLFLLGGYFLCFSCRMTKANPAIPLPVLRVAMVVTKAPAEPWAVVESTLTAMLHQEMPYDFDVWLADEHPTGKTLRWCRTHHVHVSTRQRDPRYHQTTWPRRTRSKEGNLAYFYDHFGYRRYDVVVQLDADHVPAQGYLQAMVRPFADPGIGYVAAPSICDSNADKGWTVKGRLHREASLHGPVQAGSNGGWGPLCIGSHYAVRTAALKEVGGLGPELAEDYATTLWLQSAGWGGAFALDAEAHGEGPETFDDMIVQELQWSRSLGTVLTKWAPKKFRTVPLRARARMGFALLFYLVQGIVCIASAVLPSVGVLTGVAWGNTSFADFYVHLWLTSMCLVLVLWWLRHCGVLRPTTAKLWSVDLALFQLVRWPWTTWGFFEGMWAGRREVPKPFMVTPKGSKEMRPLTPKLLAPVLALALLPVAVLAIAPDPGSVPGLVLVLLLQTTLYLSATAMVIVRHVAANRRVRSAGPQGVNRPPLLTWSTGGTAAAATATAFAVSVLVLALRFLVLPA
jgi:cellulose synthase (UDP-forming)